MQEKLSSFSTIPARCSTRWSRLLDIAAKLVAVARMSSSTSSVASAGSHSSGFVWPVCHQRIFHHPRAEIFMGCLNQFLGTPVDASNPVFGERKLIRRVHHNGIPGMGWSSPSLKGIRRTANAGWKTGTKEPASLAAPHTAAQNGVCLRT